MRVKMLTTAAGPDGPFEAGRTYHVPDEMPPDVAKAFLQANAATATKSALVTEAPEVEAAVVEPAETATAPRQKAKR